MLYKEILQTGLPRQKEKSKHNVASWKQYNQSL